MTLEIYRMSQNNQSYSTIPASERLRMDDPAPLPDAGMSLRRMQVAMTRTRTENPAPEQNEARRPDTGFQGITYTIIINIDPGAGGLARLRTWAVQPNIVRSSTPLRDGRFGLRNTDQPEFDVHPAEFHGLKLASLNIDREDPHAEVITGTIVLEFSGNAAKIGDVSRR